MKKTSKILVLVALPLLLVTSVSAYVLLDPPRTWDSAPTYVIDDRGMASITDNDGDTASARLDIGADLLFADDTPTAEPTLTAFLDDDTLVEIGDRNADRVDLGNIGTQCRVHMVAYVLDPPVQLFELFRQLLAFAQQHLPGVGVCGIIG